MARHSHWAQIKLKKGATDKKRGKIFTKHAHLIEVVARLGGDPNMNAGLRLAIDNARADNMPRENIERAIKKGTGELKGATQTEEITYEGYGPGGVALVIETLTDNRNRTGQMVRRALEEHGGSLGGSGSTSFLFETRGVMNVKKSISADEDELALIDAGAEDLDADSEGYTVFCAPSKLNEVKKKIEAAGFFIVSSEISLEPKTPMVVEDGALAQKVISLVEALEENDDVLKVSTNMA